MKKLLNTLYVTTPGAFLGQKGETVRVSFEQEELIRVPVHNLEGIVCLGAASMSPHAMRLCAENGVSVSFLSEYGRFYARVQGPVSGNVLLRREQYRRADDAPAAAAIARTIVTAKILNSRSVLQRGARDHHDENARGQLKTAAARLARSLEDLGAELPCEQVRGCEGEAARTYFGVFDHLITAQKNDFYFRERSRRPPLDNVNALLSFIYTLLVHDVTSALESVGLDPAVGYLHAVRPGRPSLALDLMEELRPYLADRLALSLVNRQQLNKKDFRTLPSGAVTMSDQAKKTLLTAYQKRKQETIRHPFVNETVAIGLLPFIQALLMARFIRGDLDAYPAFVWR